MEPCLVTKYSKNYLWKICMDKLGLTYNYFCMYAHNIFIFICGVSMNVQMVCTIMGHTIKFIKHSLL